MNLKWSLKELYPAIDSKEFKEDLEKLDKVIEEYKVIATEIDNKQVSDKEKLEGYINKLTELFKLFDGLGAFVHLMLSTNTKDALAAKYSDVLDSKEAVLSEYSSKVEKWISTIEDIDKVINASEVLKEHEFIIKEIVQNSKYLLSDKEEAIIAKMKNTGSNAWAKLKDNLISNLKVEVDGEEKPLTVVLNMAYAKDKETRKKGYEAEIKSYVKVEEGVAAALNGIKGEAITVSKLRGYKSPLDMTLVTSRMDKEILDAMLEAMKESMPAFRKYLRKKAEMLGYKNGLPFYELYAPVSKAKMEFTYEQAGDFVVKNFNTFSEHLSSFARNAIDNFWIDVMPREGKVGGGFCANLHSIGESRVLLNFGGNFGDVVTLAHELGHAFHGECLKNESILNAEYPMPIAETASTFAETIIKKAAVKEADKDEALAIIEAEVSDSTQVIVDIYSRFLFEKWLIEKREESSLTVEEIKELMLKAQKEAYGDGLDPEFLHPYMWTWKPHYYYADANFYNFPYAFGLLFAKGLYARYLEQGSDFAKDYEKLLSVTGKKNVYDIGKEINIDLRSKEFWEKSLKVVEEDINRFLEY
ncbi:MAG: M3 family oligoendopeptidase [Clostridiaceae bacterium]|nr:M3 family oligoendopeptidase [Clostridiaceae bacterium]